ncbi:MULTISPECIES: hypothetical protein [unclassified Nocardiopsis]|uniref:hypothetical protein n=1 Tax=unclassified Nocardiopsis TaxID=2649073 RepID=UPI00135C4584|nr:MULTISPECIES: hypothetical protein [unclassified Nocardiopsis]
MLHRRCQDRITALEEELRTVRDRIADRDRENARLRDRVEDESRARWDAAGEAVVRGEQVERLERELEAYRHAETVPARRRARAAWRTLWRSPSTYPSDREYEAGQAARAAAAQAILAMPLSMFAGELSLRGGTYYLDNTPLYVSGPSLPGLSGPDLTRVLMDRYGLTDADIALAHREEREQRVREIALRQDHDEEEDEDTPVVI